MRLRARRVGPARDSAPSDPTVDPSRKAEHVLHEREISYRQSNMRTDERADLALELGEWEKDVRVRRPIEDVVLNAWVSQTVDVIYLVEQASRVVRKQQQKFRSEGRPCADPRLHA
jgi:hypothetical protein